MFWHISAFDAQQWPVKFYQVGCVKTQQMNASVEAKNNMFIIFYINLTITVNHNKKIEQYIY